VSALEFIAAQWQRELAEARVLLAEYRATIKCHRFMKAKQAEVCRRYLDTRRARHWLARPDAHPERISA